MNVVMIALRQRTGRGRCGFLNNALILAFVLAASFVASPAAANPRFAALTVDAHTGKILFARNADAQRYPASLTKVMTLYCLFEELKAGRMKLDTPITMSAHAAAQPPSKIGLKPGSTLRVEDAIGLLVTKSANDVAAAVAEAISGSESRFAERMTQTAKRLGMTRTRFRNASGLPDNQQVTTARDMATLALRLQADFPQYYHYFSLPSYTFRGRTYPTHNKLIGRYKGTDGVKTGYIRASGFNLTASVRRDGKHLIGVVMGGRTGATRNKYMMSMLDNAFPKATRRNDSPLVAAAGSPPKLAQLKQPPIPMPKPVQTASAETTGAPVVAASMAVPVAAAATASAEAAIEAAKAEGSLEDNAPEHTGWLIQVGAYLTKEDANRRLEEVLAKGLGPLGNKNGFTESFYKDEKVIYRARFAGFEDGAAARAACSALKRQRIPCFSLAPNG